MRAKQSAGLLMFRRGEGGIELLLAHPGGPYWEARYEGAWTIPKGGIDDGETPLETAVREFKEETGFDACGPFIPLGHITQRSGKVVHAWAFEGTCDPAAFVSLETTTEWPPRSGRFITIPEVDAVRFFSADLARTAINQGQIPLVDRILALVN
jgi:predicted NUDIX family NTP pyrophosphohydrolase